MGSKEKEIMEFLSDKIFNPILNSPKATNSAKQGVRYTIMRLNEHDANGMISYFWSAISGGGNSTSFSKKLKLEGFDRFEEILEEFRDKFDNNWIRKKLTAHNTH